MTENIERRRNGVYTAKISNGHGEEERLIINVHKWRGYIAFFIALFAIGGSVLGLLRFGVRHEVEAAIEIAVTPPDGKVHEAIELCVQNKVDVLDKTLDTRFDLVERDLAVLQQQITDAKVEQQRQHDELIRVIRNGR